MENQKQGYQEIEHTADWELHVWAPDLKNLFMQAAAGMYTLSGTVLDPGDRIVREIQLDAPDSESLLVSFLAELLFWGESEDLGFDEFSIRLVDGKVEGEVRGGRIAAQEKEIKAVTYHQLEIQKTATGLEVNIVFDV